MDSQGRDPNLWVSVYVTVVIDLFKKDYVVGIYIQFIYRNYLLVLQKIPNHVMKHIKYKSTLVNLLPHLQYKRLGKQNGLGEMVQGLESRDPSSKLRFAAYQMYYLRQVN